MIVEGKEVKVLFEFPVLYQGWECDNIGYLVLDGNKKRIVMSSHGCNFFPKNKVIEEKMKEYRNAIRLTKIALKQSYEKTEGKK